MVERYGLDPLRYYLMRSLPVGSDGTFTPEDYVGRINYELANDLGNLLNRTVSMINKYFDGQIPAYVEGVTDFDNELAQVAEQSIADYNTYMEQLTIHVHLKQSGPSSLALTNTSMRQLHGYWLRTKRTVSNWQV